MQKALNCFCKNCRGRAWQDGTWRGRPALVFWRPPGSRPMATNPPAGDGHRNGAVRKRSQLKTKMMGEEHFTKRSKKNGQFMAQKKGNAKFKGVRKEKAY